MLLFAGAGAGQTPKRTVSVNEEGFKPAVVLVAPGTDVTWQNAGAAKHSSLGGFWNSGDLAPGASFTTRFKRFGEFKYHDGGNPSLTGTVVVIAATRPGPARGSAKYFYRATAALSVREDWEYWDSQWHSTKGACNAEVGKGSRIVRWTARIPLLTYTRAFGFEGLFMDRGVPTRLGVWREQQDAKVADGGVALCPDGTTEPPAEHDAKCTEDLGGKLLKIKIAWSPKASKNRVQFSNEGGDIAPRPETCGGPSHVGALALVDVKNEELPLWLVGDRVLFDEGAAGPLTTAEVRALRVGRNLRIVRDLDLAFTAPCCVGYNPPFGVYARIGAVITTKARFDVRLTRR